MAFSGGGPSNPEINITPLIDVLLVLIIIFIVIDVTQSPKRQGLDAEIPEQQQNSKTAPTPERTIVLQVMADGKEKPPIVRINTEEVNWDQLNARLLGIYKTRAEKVAFVQADKEIDFDWIAQVIDIAHESGIARIGLITSEPSQVARLH